MKLLKIGISGVRGIVGGTLTPGVAYEFACAFGTLVGAGKTVRAAEMGGWSAAAGRRSIRGWSKAGIRSGATYSRGAKGC